MTAFCSDAAMVRKEIQTETDRMTGKSKQISPVPIHLSIYSPNGRRTDLQQTYKWRNFFLDGSWWNDNILVSPSSLSLSLFPLLYPPFLCSCQLDIDWFAWFNKGCSRYTFPTLPESLFYFSITHGCAITINLFG